jgi:hypothetical protein
MGISRLSLYGSVARNEQRVDSDVDLAADFNTSGNADYEGIHRYLQDILGKRVDLVREPLRDEKFRAEVNRDRIVVF